MELQEKIIISFIILILQGVAYSQQTTPPTFRQPILSGIPSEPLDTIPTVYYISDSGDDSNTGLDSAHTFRTITKLQSIQLISGDTVRFKGGDTITGNCSIYRYNFWSYNYTNKYKNIVFNSYGSGKAVLSGGNIILFTSIWRFHFVNLIFVGGYDPINHTDSTGNDYGIYGSSFSVSDTAHITIDSCVFTNYHRGGIGLDALSFGQSGMSGSVITIKDNEIKNMGCNGMFFSKIINTDFRIEGNTITDIYERDTGAAYSSTAISFLWCKNVILERNYINRVGYVYGNGAAGIYFTDTRNSIVRYNEIKNVRNNTVEGAGIYWDCGSDSNVAEYNYIANCNGGGCLGNSPSSYCGYPSWFFEDSLESSFNIYRYNVIIGDSGSISGLSLNNYYQGTIGTPGKRNMAYNNLIYMKRSKDIGEDYPNDSLFDITGFRQFGYSDSTYIYNNIFIIGDSVTAISHSYTRLNTLNNYYSNWLTNSKIYNNIYYKTTGGNSFMFKELTGTIHLNPLYWNYRKYSSIRNWSDSTGLEKSGINYTYINADPLIKRLTQNLSAKINPYFLDTLTCFQFNTGSPADSAGLNYNSQVSRIADTLTVDWFGTPIPYTNSDIGIYIKP